MRSREDAAQNESFHHAMVNCAEVSVPRRKRLGTESLGFLGAGGGPRAAVLLLAQTFVKLRREFGNLTRSIGNNS